MSRSGHRSLADMLRWGWFLSGIRGRDQEIAPTVSWGGVCGDWEYVAMGRSTGIGRDQEIAPTEEGLGIEMKSTKE